MKISRPHSRHAFTIAEVLMALMISGFAMAAIMTLFYYTVQNNYVSEQRSLANDDVRFFTEKLISNARASNILVLYKSLYPYFPANNNFPFTGVMGAQLNPDVNNDGVMDWKDRITPGGTGDYMVFISYSDPFPAYVAGTVPNPTVTVTRLVLYWVAPNRDFPGENAIYMFDSNEQYLGNPAGLLPWGNNLNILTTPTTLGTATSLESILPPFTQATSQAPWAQIVLNDVRGMTNFVQGTTAGDGTNFTDFNVAGITNASVLMESLILHGNSAKRVTDTYHFTITPGG
jgi:type II secretory pathway pseudopilin PulG